MGRSRVEPCSCYKTWNGHTHACWERVVAANVELSTEVDRLSIRHHECRALLQRLVKYVTEDNATTPGNTRLARLTEQVRDYLQRTHDPRSILR